MVLEVHIVVTLWETGTEVTEEASGMQVTLCFLLCFLVIRVFSLYKIYMFIWKCDHIISLN